MDCSMPGFPVLHNLPEFAQTHVHWIGDAIHLYLLQNIDYIKTCSFLEFIYFIVNTPSV